MQGIACTIVPVGKGSRRTRFRFTDSRTTFASVSGVFHDMFVYESRLVDYDMFAPRRNSACGTILWLLLTCFTKIENRRIKALKPEIRKEEERRGK